MAELMRRPEGSLNECLAAGIHAVAALHSDTCDLSDPGTPCAAVGILRIGGDTVDALSLSDVTVVVDTPSGPQVACDLAIEETCGTEPDAVRGFRFGDPRHADALSRLVECQTRTRNTDGGWWVAASEPEAAYHAATMSVPLSSVRRVAVMSDGATRPVDQMNIYRWPEYLDMLDKRGPAGLISHVRRVEADDPHGDRYPRTKRHDDASIVYGAMAE